MKLPFVSTMRDAAQKIIKKGATVAVTKAMEGMLKQQQKLQEELQRAVTGAAVY